MYRVCLFLLLLSLAILGQSCVPARTPVPQGNGEGIAGAPKPIVLTFENTRIRCEFDAKGNDVYNVECGALALIDGSEAEPLLQANNFELVWRTPSQVSGTPVSSISCEPQTQRFRQKCTVTTADRTQASILFGVTLTKADLTREESDKVSLPYGVETIGIIPTFPVRLGLSSNPPASEATPNRGITGSAPPGGGILEVIEAPVVPSGLQTEVIPEDHLFLGEMASFCYIGDELYFTAKFHHSVFQRKDGKVRLYAGTRSGENQGALSMSHRLRTVFAGVPRVNCYGGNLYVSDGNSNFRRLVRISDDSSVEVVIPSVRTNRFHFDGQGRIYYTTEEYLQRGDGSRYFNARVFRYENGQSTPIFGTGNDPRGNLGPESGDPLARTLQDFQAMTVAEDGEVFYLELPENRLTEPGRVYSIKDGVFTRKFLLSELNPPVSPGSFYNAIARDSSGNFYIGGQSIIKVEPNLNASTLDADVVDLVDSCFTTENRPEDRQQSITGVTQFRFNSKGELVYLDGGCRVLKVKSQGKPELVFRTQSLPIARNFGSNAREATFGTITTMTMAKDGTLYFADSNSYKIFKVSADGSNLSELDPYPGVSPREFQLSQISMSRALGLTVNPVNDQVVVTGLDDHYSDTSPSIPLGTKTIDASGNVATLFTGSGTLMAMDSDGGYLIGQDYSTDIRKYSADGTLVETYDISAALGPSTLGRVAVRLDGMVVGPNGNVYFSNSDINSIAMIDRSTDSNTVRFVSVAGTALSRPAGIDFDSAGRMYLADHYNHRVLQLEPSDNTGLAFTFKVFFGENIENDCAGAIQSKSASAGADANIQQTLAGLCPGTPDSIAVADTCGETDGKVKVAFTQRFSGISHIVRVTLPCP